MTKVAIEIAGERNESVRFLPAGKLLRGRLCWRSVLPSAAARATEFDNRDVPGQIVEVDGDAAVIREPLHGDDHQFLVEKIREANMKLPPEREEFGEIHAPTWFYWMARLVSAKLARVVSGKLPEIDPADAKRDYGEPRKSPEDERLDRLTGAIEKLVEALARRG